jgi:hypothetical protein
MNRRIFKLVLFLLLGAIINVAVAWGCVHFFDESYDGLQIGFPSSADTWLTSSGWAPSNFTTETPEMVANTAAPKHWTTDPQKTDVQVKPGGWLDQWSELFPGHEYRRFDWTASNQQYAFPPIGGQFRAGWPCWALYGDACAAPAGPDAFRSAMKTRKLSYAFRYALPPKQTKYPPEIRRSFPLLPIWPGFAINTIFYAAILWLLFAFPFMIRRRRRIKRGLCPACAYPVGDSAVCTECGKQVKA